MDTKNRSTQTALITGGASGIGKDITLRLAADGCDVIIHYFKNKQRALDLCTEVEALGRRAYPLQLDLGRADEINQKLKDQVSKKIGVVSILVNNAGVTHDMPSTLIDYENWNQLMQTNISAPFFMSQWFVQQLPRKRFGSIINLSSLSGQIGNAGQVSYSSSKSGLIGLTKSLSKEVARKNIRVNAIAAGIISTDMTKDNQFLESIKDQIPLKRFGDPKEISGVVSFLCSQDASYITGQTISVNGGLYCH